MIGGLPREFTMTGGKREGPPVREAFHRDSGIRTHDLLNPIQVRYQLRYVPGAVKDNA